ncbi:hypothetical protein H0H81_000685 [Sphagnurus paluster]|uniref:F-box domain-containing protein n=1 Tax=Sphagnurus paluster TaxID=117069 RepID=A0A9P7KK81_9AGAR|nr:hypothetical protein H0H81_000685 [Sphagnurus paluster]
MKLPAELWMEIFRTACTDDGSTGRALSLVSRYFYELSSEFKLHSIAIVGPQQLQNFADYLEKLPSYARHVRHLFISVVDDNFVKKSRLFGGTTDTNFWEEQTLHVISNIPRTSILIPISLPNLSSLTIHGPMHIYETHGDMLPVFPSLRHLTLKSFTEYPAGMLQDISTQAPSLRFLSFTLERPLRFLPFDLSRALLGKISPAQMVPESLICIEVQLGVGPIPHPNMWIEAARAIMIKNLWKVIEKDNRVTIVGLKQLDTYHDAHVCWLQDTASRN